MTRWMCCARAQKKSQESINSRLALVMKSGKFTLGTKTCLKCLRSGKGTLHLQPWRSGPGAPLSSRCSFGVFRVPGVSGLLYIQRCCLRCLRCGKVCFTLQPWRSGRVATLGSRRHSGASRVPGASSLACVHRRSLKELYAVLMHKKGSRQRSSQRVCELARAGSFAQ